MNDKEYLYLELRKLKDIFNIYGNCIVPSIHADKRNTTALERLRWLVDKAEKEHGLSIDDLEKEV
jgi:hypothetical protein